MVNKDVYSYDIYAEGTKKKWCKSSGSRGYNTVLIAYQIALFPVTLSVLQGHLQIFLLNLI